MPKWITRAWLVDALERVAATYLQTFFGLWLAPVLVDSAALNGVLDLSVATKAALAAAPAALSLIKTLIAAAKANTVSPASLAPVPEPDGVLVPPPGNPGDIGDTSPAGEPVA